MSEPNGHEPFLTVREMVAEIRADVKDLNRKAEHMEEAAQDIRDHEDRIRGLERWKYGIPFSGVLAIVAAITAVLGRGV